MEFPFPSTKSLRVLAFLSRSCLQQKGGYGRSKTLLPGQRNLPDSGSGLCSIIGGSDLKFKKAVACAAELLQGTKAPTAAKSKMATNSTLLTHISPSSQGFLHTGGNCQPTETCIKPNHNQEMVSRNKGSVSLILLLFLGYAFLVNNV